MRAIPFPEKVQSKQDLETSFPIVTTRIYSVSAGTIECYYVPVLIELYILLSFCFV